MNKDRLAEWIAELESGKYIQITHKVIGENPGEYCALGVATTLGYDYFADDNGMEDWLSIPEEQYELLPGGEQVEGLDAAVFVLNDSYRWDFGKIANWLRNQFNMPKE